MTNPQITIKSKNFWEKLAHFWETAFENRVKFHIHRKVGNPTMFNGLHEVIFFYQAWLSRCLQNTRKVTEFVTAKWQPSKWQPSKLAFNPDSTKAFSGSKLRKVVILWTNQWTLLVLFARDSISQLIPSTLKTIKTVQQIFCLVLEV